MARTVTASAAEIGKLLQAMARRLPLSMFRAEQQALRDVKAAAQALSDGPFQPRTLAQLGHPYARRQFRPPLPASIINRRRGKGGGAFYRGWRIRGPRKDGQGGYTSELVNIAPEARFLTAAGTDRMGPRPIRERVAALLAARRAELTERAMRDAMTPRR